MKVLNKSVIFLHLVCVGSTIIIVEDAKACFRRVLAGKRVARGFVKRAIYCERVEDCQRECADENHFSCEGFNYRLDQSGRGKGECELLDLPLSHLDIGRDLYPDPDYDYYERDRNAAASNCKSSGAYQTAGNYGYDDDFDRRYDRRPPPPLPPPRRPTFDDRYDDRWETTRRPYFEDRFDDYDRPRPPAGNRRGDFAYHSHTHNNNNHYLAHGHNDHKSYEPYLPPPVRRPPPPPPIYGDRRIDKFPHYENKNTWGLNRPDWGSYGGFYGTNPNPSEFDRKNYYLPPKREPNYWGQYGGSYGNGGGVNLQYNGYGHSQSFDFWGLKRYEDKVHDGPVAPNKGLHYLPAWRPPYSDGVLPAEPRHPPPPPPRYDFIKDECSLRSATGFRLHKGIVKKFYAVPSIYECELLCFKEKEFACASYAFRYTVSLSSAPTDNCYLSNRNYKELDYYTDIQPDRDFDIYTMNNMKRCEQPSSAVVPARQNSECFWRVRSAQRLDYKVVRDSLRVKSIVECQVECLRARTFTCRAFSFRYDIGGHGGGGGSIDNCQLTDWPFYELDPRVHFVPETGFELYERGSFGHGCEPNHFGIRGGARPPWNKQPKLPDEHCYIAFTSPAKLLNQATRKHIHAVSEEECKAECSRLRQNTIFQCMSLSFSSQPSNGQPNCRLSDILQRDLLPNVDYGPPESDAWLFAWDNYNPECRSMAHDFEKNHLGGIEDRFLHYLPSGMDTWRVYSVSGWPCKRNTQCRENREAGFWFCELEGRENNAWDYCCRPDHQCGYSEGFRYPWCYVGPERTQWRQCSDRYHPYTHNYIDRLDTRPWSSNYLPEGDNIRPPPQHYLPPGGFRPPPADHYLPENNFRPPYRPGIHPDRPPARPTIPPPRPSLDEYEMQFDSQFLDPPKPGGFAGRHWPLSYLHKEMPPNSTDESKTMQMSAARSNENPKYQAIQNLIDVIKSNDLSNVQYHISNESNKQDDILFVKIPLPGNFTEVAEKKTNATSVELNSGEKSKRSQKALPLTVGSKSEPNRPVPVYRRSYVTRTNVTNHGRGTRSL